ncbi:unnamed protein product [Penicillium egyptiacum]|uniref:Beta-glucuronidase C-terminal domain-containing protein n=1 Tax=Penicillium egyptiacum TaxID=1303716 RepID=A0A9W4P8W6_9EURO|nr:unnamed protein product [Penicillium egyptiacum]
MTNLLANVLSPVRMAYFLAFILVLQVVLASSFSTIKVPLDSSRRILRPDIYGYSIEPSSVDPYIQSNLTSNILKNIAQIIGKPAPIRVGGNIADQTQFEANLRTPSSALPNDTEVEVFRIRKDWFAGWRDYFPSGTDFVYTLNLRNTTGSWSTAMKEAEAAIDILGKSLSLFELGNEIDHYVSKGWRKPGWDTKQYISQWHNLTNQILSSAFYKQAKRKPHFQAAVFADPPSVPDQQDEVDDFDIINVTRAGLVDTSIIQTYAVHLYPQSTCDAARESRLSLNLLSDHQVIWTNLSQYIPQEAAAQAANRPLILGEANSASCSGKSGISDTFGAALWGTDFVLTAASIGIEQVYFHLGHQSEYSAFTPLSYEYKGENLSAGIRANFYSHMFLAHVLAGNNGWPWEIAALPTANASDFSGYAIFAGDQKLNLEKLVFIDLGVWNSTHGLHNPSTLSFTDSEFASSGTRPQRKVQVHTPWKPGTRIEILKLQGPGTNAKSDINVSGVSLDSRTGNLRGQRKNEEGIVQNGGLVQTELLQTEAILIQKA